MDKDVSLSAQSNEVVSTKLRLFLAIQIPQAIKREVERTQAELRRSLPQQTVRWTRPEQFHLTLKFLGNVDSAQTPALTEVLTGVCLTFQPLALRACGVGAFPDAHAPRVIWIGINDTQNALASLHQALDSACQPFTSEPAEEKFSGHVTLGRVKRIRRPESKQLREALSTMTDRAFGQWSGSAVELIQSELSSEGPRYRTLASLQLLAA